MANEIGRKRRRCGDEGAVDDKRQKPASRLGRSVNPSTREMERETHLQETNAGATEDSDCTLLVGSDSSPLERANLRVAILVPFRESHEHLQRQQQLDRFIPYMTKQMKMLDGISFHIVVLEQSADGRKFNKGKLLNAGFDIIRDEYDVFIFHDVDLLPGVDLMEFYSMDPMDGPIHIASVWGRYNANPNYFGGIVSFRKEDFTAINGFPNNFWGWGGEDDELYCRVKRMQLTVQSPTTGEITDLESLSLQEKLDLLWEQKCKCTAKRDILKEHRHTWYKNGLSTLQYDVKAKELISECCTKITVDVGLNNHWTDRTASAEHGVAHDAR